MPFEALLQAMDLAAKSSSAQFKEVMGAGKEKVEEGKDVENKGLAALPDITSEYLGKKPEPEGPGLQKSVHGLHKAALVNFQTWSMRKAGLVGLIYARPNKSKKKWNFARLIVDKSLDTIWNDGKVDTSNKRLEIKCIGMALVGHSNDKDLQSLAQTWCPRFLTAEILASLCVFVPWLLL